MYGRNNFSKQSDVCLMTQKVKNLPTMQIRVGTLGQEDPPGKEMAI